MINLVSRLEDDMQEQVDLIRLREFIKAHPKFTVPAPTSDDLDNMLLQYREYMEKHGYDHNSIEIYIVRAKCAFEICGYLDQYSPEYGLLRELMFKYEQASLSKDKRNPNYVVYSVDVVLTVVMLAKLCGCNNCTEYAKFWFTANPYLQCLIPGMPAPSYMISSETIATCLKLVPDDCYEAIFHEMFAEVKLKLKDMLLNEDPNPDNKDYRPTIGGDGQELRASYRKGESSRQKKGCHAVVIFNCDERVALGYTGVRLKNHEIDGFEKVLKKSSVPKDGIFYADAINTRKSFIEFLNERELDWLLAVKGQKSTKLIYQAIKTRFSSDTKATFSKSLPPKLVSGRIEERRFEVVPISELELENDFTAKTAVRVVKHTTFKLNTAEKTKRETTVTRYFISSLECTEENFEQIIHSVSVRWYYEQHHNTIDEVLLQDRQAVCDEEHLAAIIGLNKFAFNVLSFARQKLSMEGYAGIRHRSKKHRPMSYRSTVDSLRQDPSLAFKILLRYLATDSVDAE